MTELLKFLWTSAPELVSLLGVVAVLVFICVKLTLFFSEFKQMGVRITSLEVRMSNVENRLDRLEQKVDSIIEFLINKFGK
ncbi:MAG: hypothetical protein WDO15_22580 [Bacteroidota bacterium]